MEETVIATREILWNIPDYLKITMYSLLVVAVGIFLYGAWTRARFVTNQKSVKNLFAADGLMPNAATLQWRQLLKALFFTGKVTRDHNVGFFHSLIFYGFLILWIATDLVAIHYDTPFKVFTGTTYIVISFLADFAGLMVLAGIGFAWHRRYSQKPAKLSASKPNQEKVMYAFLIALVIIGYLIEGIRILGNGLPEGERVWSPIGFALAHLFTKFSWSDDVWSTLHRALWFFHMANTMFFVAILPYTKFFHFLALPLQAFVTPPRRGGVLNPMNFENENAESFGLSKFSEMTMKNRFDLISCVECGRCTEVCPAKAAGKNLDPKTIITKARDLVFAEQKNGVADPLFWGDKPIYESHELDACTTCAACMEECPAHIEHVNIIMEAKRYKALTLGDLPPSAADATNKSKINGNPWGISQDDRFKWADGLDVPVIAPGQKVDYLYFVGCAGSYDANNQKAIKATIALMKKAGVSFALLGKLEKCCGDPVRRFGDEYSFLEIAMGNIETFRQYEFDKIVTHCPHCLHTIGKEYAKFENGNFPMVHQAELLAELIKSGKLKPEKEVKTSLTFHDPCYLGRHHGAYDAPRTILNSIPGLEVKEMAKSQDRARCCGMGGGNMWFELPEGEHLAHNRLRDIAEVSKDKLATACPYCMINFNSAKGHIETTANMDVEDVASLLAKSVL
ncbi:MAG: hypothetical protein A2X86_09860 [Bdellovibrionales bacterium GWA2_49_15]|nr:MAG: hypothetical protein A2X86_09860 [Bdellovibrionales bacterium GWA2_49_15]HAZ13088.1 hypothetical protein [Bdellovibrionales bacterium]